METILVTGSDGRFGKILKKIKTKKIFIFKNKKDLNVLSSNSINKNLRKHNLDIIRNNVGYVPQSTFLFSDTILNNIKFY